MNNTKIKDYYYNPKTNANSSYIYTSDYCQYKVLRDECWAVMNDLITAMNFIDIWIQGM